MCLEPLEVTRTSLATCCTSLCNSSSRNPYSLNKGLLVKYWWCLTSTPWTTSTSSPSTSHLHMSNDKLSSNAVSLRCKHNPETLFVYQKIYFIHNVHPFIGNARQSVHILNHIQQKKIFYFISSYFIKFYFFIHLFIFENLVNNAHEQCPNKTVH